MAFSMIEGRWVYGPLGFTDGHGDLKPVSFTASQQIVLTVSYTHLTLPTKA